MRTWEAMTDGDGDNEAGSKDGGNPIQDLKDTAVRGERGCAGAGGGAGAEGLGKREMGCRGIEQVI